jgi:hypothetical protein
LYEDLGAAQLRCAAIACYFYFIDEALGALLRRRRDVVSGFACCFV